MNLPPHPPRPQPGPSPRGRLTLVLGGQKSGKSGLAARRAEASGRPVVVVAPAVVRDEEFKARVERHRADRPPHWRTLETFDLAAAVAEAGDGTFVLVDALDTWLAETLESAGVFVGDDVPDSDRRARAEDAVVAALRAFTGAVAALDVEVVVIAGQPGLGVHAGGPGARLYVDVHGRAVQTLSAAADEALLVVGGRVVRLEPDAPPAAPADPRLREHGDTQVPPGATDLAVNVQPGPPPWLADRLAAAVRDLAAYPDDRAARAAAAARHGRPPEECLVVDGAAEAFWLLADALRPRLAACVHPSFTEPEAALRAAGVPVVRVWRRPEQGWRLDPSAVPSDADLVVLGRPDNPTGVLDPVETVAALARPGRTVVVDEAFAEFLDDAGGVAGRRDLPGVVAVRSLTKLWGLAGLRVGYVTGPPDIVARLAARRQPWSVNSLALTAIEALTSPVAEDERRARAAAVAELRAELIIAIRALGGPRVWDAHANFVLVQAERPGLRERLLEHGLAARRADTFPGLDDRAVRVAVRDRETTARLVAALRTIEDGSPA
ncbi:Rv2231c family pyridoxal phosphate-dependent protein CobC [Jiangella alba]|uniref:Aminotransferase n=1 Tax=Jiangella alba TaxID=561176 RepID=A0A1H5PLP7_9ACTN|nr:Rv2231c family pyridoxal phosphate-dependent protein CobC [Jiangella alba]SEF14685.1 Histidinol-phosphate/aromatic aminotransferase or cobyric acid decarboxylase [Jiangella alba]